jgi:hypothetical protein
MKWRGMGLAGVAVVDGERGLLDLKIRTCGARSIWSILERVLTPLKREEIIARLRENEAALRARGVAHAALFGSRARGDQRQESDTDIMIEFDPAARITVFDYAGLKRDIAELFHGPVDVVNRDGLKPYLKPAPAEVIYAF